MAETVGKKRRYRWVKYALGIFLLFFIGLLFFINRFVEPILRDRIHTLIVNGSDSLYHYELGELKANFFGGNVEVSNLHLWVDSSRYRELKSRNALPSLTMEADLGKGRIRGLGVIALMFGKKIKVTEILSKDANIKLSRHVHERDRPISNVPLWKAIQPTIKSIEIDKINLDGVKLLYKNADTSEAVKLQFDRCVALFEDIRIDSSAYIDTTRIGFAEKVSMQFYDLKFRTPDSLYKMKAEIISYSSVTKSLEVKDFKLQPTLKDEEFYKNLTYQKNSYVIEFKRALFTNLQLDLFIHSNVVSADSMFLYSPEITIGNDKTLPPALESKIGDYPHQKLLTASATIRIKGVKIVDGKMQYTERAAKTKREGVLGITNINVAISNVTNDPVLIKKNNQCTMVANATLFNASPLNAKFTFYLDSTEGEFKAEGEGTSIHAADLNALSDPLSNIQINSLFISSLKFNVSGDDYSALGSVAMRYNNLSVIFKKQDEETGAITTKKFLTKLFNKFTIYPANPYEGVERTANNVVYARVSSIAFFGVIWKTIFAGMQNVALKSGRVD